MGHRWDRLWFRITPTVADPTMCPACKTRPAGANDGPCDYCQSAVGFKEWIEDWELEIGQGEDDG